MIGRESTEQGVPGTSRGRELDLAGLTHARHPDDLGYRLQDVLRDYFDGAVTAVYQRLSDQSWIPVGTAADPGSAFVPDLDPGQTGAVLLLDEGTRMVGVQRSVNRHEFAVSLTAAGRRVFGEREILALRVVLAAVDAAWTTLHHRTQSREMVFELNRRVLQLTSLIDTGIEVATLDQAVSPCQLALERAVALTNASRGAVTVRENGVIVEQHVFPQGAGGIGAEEGPLCLVSDFEFRGSFFVFTLVEKESRDGVQPFDATDRLLLDALSRQVHASLENRFLVQQSLEKQKMDQDVAVAASIQQRILPSTLPQVEGYDIAGINIPSRSVGGDYYDCIVLPDGRLMLTMADVAGKGIPAALLVSSFHAYLSAYLEGDLPLPRMVARLNTAIHRASTDDKFITAFFALLDPVSGAVECVNAGHNTVYCRRRDGSGQDLTTGGIPLGMLGLDFPYQSEHIVLDHGDRLLLYTDGIPEAQNAAAELYETRTPLREFFLGRTPDTAASFVDALIADVSTFVGAAPQADDMTVLYLLRH